MRRVLVLGLAVTLAAAGVSEAKGLRISHGARHGGGKPSSITGGETLMTSPNLTKGFDTDLTTGFDGGLTGAKARGHADPFALGAGLGDPGQTLTTDGGAGRGGKGGDPLLTSAPKGRHKGY